MEKMNGRIKREVQPTKLPILGDIKIGRKRDDGVPESLDYFVASGPWAPKFREAFKKDCGGRPGPNKIEIVFLSDDRTECCREWWEIRKGKKVFGYGDGETFLIWTEKEKDPETGKFGTYKKIFQPDEPAIMEMTEEFVGAKWVNVLELNFLIPRIHGILGVWRFRTRAAKSSILKIISVWDFVQGRAKTVVNFPFDLVVQKHTSQKMDSRAKYPVVTLVCNFSAESMDIYQEFLSQGERISGLITEERLKQYIDQKKQLAPGQKDLDV